MEDRVGRAGGLVGDEGGGDPFGSEVGDWVGGVEGGAGSTCGLRRWGGGKGGAVPKEGEEEEKSRHGGEAIY